MIRGKGKVFNVPYRRKRKGHTTYKKRIKLLMFGKHRFVVRKSLKNLNASIVEYNSKGYKVLFTVTSKTLVKLGWKGDKGNLPSAYLIGMIAGKKAKEKGISEAILDLGLNKSSKGSRIYAALAGALDSGLKIPANPEILPPKERISGSHIAKYAMSIKSTPKYEAQFSDYLKKGLMPEDFVKHFTEIKGKING